MKLRSMLRVRPLLALTACAAAAAPLIAPLQASTPLPRPHAQEVIDARRDGFNTIGWASKAINDQLKTRAPGLNRIATAAETIHKMAPEIAYWFPAGTGPESRLDTKAMPEIWSKRAHFDALTRELVAESQRLQDAIATQDVAAIRTQFTALRQVCSRCHRAYLAD
jgi:cytochrome c556